MLTHSLGWIRSLCVFFALSCAADMAVAAEPAEAVAAASDTQTVSLAGGKLRFDLKGFDARALPGDNAGTMYFDEQSNQAIIVTEGQVPVAAGDTSADAAFRLSVDTLKEKQHAASPNYRIVNETMTTVNGLKVYHLEATDDVNGMQLLMAALMVVSDQKITVIEVMSDVKDPSRHTAAVKNILGK